MKLPLMPRPTEGGMEERELLAMEAAPEPQTTPIHKITLTDLEHWLQERYDNCIRIAGQKTGDDRKGWMEDADYFHAALAHLQGCPCGMPPQLTEKIQNWLDANKKQPCEVRYGSFPLGMVQGWIERAEKAERNDPL